jgi:hypothetical protein
MVVYTFHADNGRKYKFTATDDRTAQRVAARCFRDIPGALFCKPPASWRDELFCPHSHVPRSQCVGCRD